MNDGTNTSRRAFLVAGVAALAGCTVKPLYSDGPGLTTGSPPGSSSLSMPEIFRSIEIEPAGDRATQEVRNHLIFLFYGGGTAPENPRYRLRLQLDATVANVAIRQGGARGGVPTAGVATVGGRYYLDDLTAGRTIFNRQHSVSSAYDIPQQRYAVARAERDAVNRAARELAEFIRLTLAAELTAEG